MGASWSVVLAELTLPLLVSFLFLFRETRVELARHCSMRDEGGDDEQVRKYASKQAHGCDVSVVPRSSIWDECF